MADHLGGPKADLMAEMTGEVKVAQTGGRTADRLDDYWAGS